MYFSVQVINFYLNSSCKNPFLKDFGLLCNCVHFYIIFDMGTSVTDSMIAVSGKELIHGVKFRINHSYSTAFFNYVSP